MPDLNYINLADDELDQSIYRIMPVDRLLQCLDEKQLVLVPPSKWCDPFENWLLRSKVILSTGEIGDMNGIHDKVYGQCWTQHEETDAMWRIYSTDRNGAKVKTTPRKLLNSLKSNNHSAGDVSCFIGKVEYQTEAALASSLTRINVLNANGSGIAKSLLYKRLEFVHEKEVRLIYLDGSGSIYRFAIDPNLLFDEIVFDPRVDKHLFSAYKNAVIAKGFLGKVSQSNLYELPQKLEIKVDC